MPFVLYAILDFYLLFSSYCSLSKILRCAKSLVTLFLEMYFARDHYLNLSVSLLHFYLQHPKSVVSIIPCIFHNFLLENYFCMLKKTVIGFTDIKDKSGDHLPLKYVYNIYYCCSFSRRNNQILQGQLKIYRLMKRIMR